MELLAKYYIIDDAEIGEKTVVRNYTNLYGCKIGKNCKIACYAEIQRGVEIGDDCKVEAFAFIPSGVKIGDRVFVGPHVCFTNDMRPRAINADGTPKDADDWVLSKTLVQTGAAIGANSTIRCGVNLGEWCLVGSGSVVTRDVPAYGLVYGNPAQLHGFVCPCGERLEKIKESGDSVLAKCPACEKKIEILKTTWTEKK